MGEIKQKEKEKAGKWNKEQKLKKNRKTKSIKRTFMWYLPLCVVVAYLGAYGIGLAANELQYWYEVRYSDLDYAEELKKAHAKYEQLMEDGAGNFSEIPEEEEIAEIGIVENTEGDSEGIEKLIRIEYHKTVNGIMFYDVHALSKFVSDNPWHRFVYGLISHGQGILMLVWMFGCVAVTARKFYKRELEGAVEALLDASEKISDNCLDFEMKPVKQNELGQVCRSFEKMRQALYENNRELWHTLEERKRLNAAFSHDIRTPLSVLKGYQEMLKNYIPEGRFSQEQVMEMVETMGSQISRLENYTQKMSMVQKLEDIVPERKSVEVAELAPELKETGNFLAGSLEFEMIVEEMGRKTVSVDKELFLEVFENMVSNAARFAQSRITVTMTCRKPESGAGGLETQKEKQDNPQEKEDASILCIIVEDDGSGFSEEALHRATDPFYGSEKDGRVHFGLGLYVCRLICERNGGRLLLENRAEGNAVCGGKVIAEFSL